MTDMIDRNNYNRFVWLIEIIMIDLRKMIACYKIMLVYKDACMSHTWYNIIN